MHVSTSPYSQLWFCVPFEDCDFLIDALWQQGTEGIEEKDVSPHLEGETDPSGFPPDFYQLVTSLISGSDTQNVRIFVAGFSSWTDTLEHFLGSVPENWIVTRIEISDQPWLDTWKQWIEPIEIAGTLVIHPSWVENNATDLDANLPILMLDSDRSFGSGTHPTTQTVLAHMKQHIHSGDTVLDLGCGSGVLACAALLFGAISATAVDIDPDALVTTKENAELNSLNDRLVICSVNEFLKSEDCFDVVVANIGAATLQSYAKILWEKCNKFLIVSGILSVQIDAVRTEYCVQGFIVHEQIEKDGWVTLCLKKN